MTSYAEIILPLPIYSTFTYSVPDDIEADLQVGSRVLVQFGRKKYYTGIVSLIHTRTPDYEVKPIMALLDPRPVVRYPQLKFWDWIAEYYLCSPGEVYKAAVPTGLKPESETFVTINDDYEPEEGFSLSERQALIIALLQDKKRLRISEIEAETKMKDTARIINSMLEHDLIGIDEKVVEKYKPKKETFVTICADREERDKVHGFFDLVRRSQQQERLLISWLDMSGWLVRNSELRDVSRRQLLEATGATAATLKRMEEKGIFRMEKRTINRFNSAKASAAINLSPLSEAQASACNEITESMRANAVTLLHGVTGSGKTEIYSHLIAKTLEEGNQVLYLVPEISLTTQLTDRLRRIFGDRLLVYHSKFSDNERVDIWKRLLSGNEPLVILGVRSSVFLPFARLGLVVVDEEHESSYKQYDPAPRYNARDAATVLATMHGAKVVLGSATPSVETYYKAQSEKYGLVTLSERFRGATLPSIELVNMPEQREKKLNTGILSSPLKQSMKASLEKGGQAIVFQNRRGFAPVVVCGQCGWVPKCENCDVSLVYHKNSSLLRCHYCGFTRVIPTVCPACGLNGINKFGYGTERIAEEIHEQFSDYKVQRMDLDTTRNKDAYQEIIEGFAAKKTDILVGTQMISKGLDFEKVNVVGVVNADTLLNFPDFRSNERAFNMLAQVAGRAGRRDSEGKVIIQTSKPQDPVLQFVKAHDYQGYYKAELAERKKYGYPPFTRVINVFLKNKDPMMIDRAAVTLALRLRAVFGDRVLGPEKPFVSRVATWYLQSIMLKVEAGASMKKVKNILRGVYEQIAQTPEMKGTIVYYDVDPV